LNVEEIFLLNALDDIHTGKFRFDILLAFVGGLFWLKIMMLLRLTRTFGPIIKIISSMLETLVIFLILWLIIIMFFACMGMLLF
jgi:hypothetical protein